MDGFHPSSAIHQPPPSSSFPSPFLFYGMNSPPFADSTGGKYEVFSASPVPSSTSLDSSVSRDLSFYSSPSHHQLSQSGSSPTNSFLLSPPAYNSPNTTQLPSILPKGLYSPGTVGSPISPHPLHNHLRTSGPSPPPPRSCSLPPFLPTSTSPTRRFPSFSSSIPSTSSSPGGLNHRSPSFEDISLTSCPAPTPHLPVSFHPMRPRSSYSPSARQLEAFQGPFYTRTGTPVVGSVSSMCEEGADYGPPSYPFAQSDVTGCLTSGVPPASSGMMFVAGTCPMLSASSVASLAQSVYASTALQESSLVQQVTRSAEKLLKLVPSEKHRFTAPKSPNFPALTAPPCVDDPSAASSPTSFTGSSTGSSSTATSSIPGLNTGSTYGFTSCSASDSFAKFHGASFHRSHVMADSVKNKGCNPYNSSFSSSCSTDSKLDAVGIDMGSRGNLALNTEISVNVKMGFRAHISNHSFVPACSCDCQSHNQQLCVPPEGAYDPAQSVPGHQPCAGHCSTANTPMYRSVSPLNPCGQISSFPPDVRPQKHGGGPQSGAAFSPNYSHAQQQNRLGSGSSLHAPVLYDRVGSPHVGGGSAPFVSPSCSSAQQTFNSSIHAIHHQDVCDASAGPSCGAPQEMDARNNFMLNGAFLNQQQRQGPTPYIQQQRSQGAQLPGRIQLQGSFQSHQQSCESRYGVPSSTAFPANGPPYQLPSTENSVSIPRLPQQGARVAQQCGERFQPRFQLGATQHEPEENPMSPQHNSLASGRSGICGISDIPLQFQVRSNHWGRSVPELHEGSSVSTLGHVASQGTNSWRSGVTDKGELPTVVTAATLPMMSPATSVAHGPPGCLRAAMASVERKRFQRCQGGLDAIPLPFPHSTDPSYNDVGRCDHQAPASGGGFQGSTDSGGCKEGDDARTCFPSARHKRSSALQATPGNEQAPFSVSSLPRVATLWPPPPSHAVWTSVGLCTSERRKANASVIPESLRRRDRWMLLWSPAECSESPVDESYGEPEDDSLPKSSEDQWGQPHQKCLHSETGTPDSTEMTENMHKQCYKSVDKSARDNQGRGMLGCTTPMYASTSELTLDSDARPIPSDFSSWVLDCFGEPDEFLLWLDLQATEVCATLKTWVQCSRKPPASFFLALGDTKKWKERRSMTSEMDNRRCAKGIKRKKRLTEGRGESLHQGNRKRQQMNCQDAEGSGRSSAISLNGGKLSIADESQMFSMCGAAASPVSSPTGTDSSGSQSTRAEETYRGYSFYDSSNEDDLPLIDAQRLSKERSKALEEDAAVQRNKERGVEDDRAGLELKTDADAYPVCDKPFFEFCPVCVSANCHCEASRPSAVATWAVESPWWCSFLNDAISDDRFSYLDTEPDPQLEMADTPNDGLLFGSQWDDHPVRELPPETDNRPEELLPEGRGVFITGGRPPSSSYDGNSNESTGGETSGCLAEEKRMASSEEDHIEIENDRIGERLVEERVVVEAS